MQLDSNDAGRIYDMREAAMKVQRIVSNATYDTFLEDEILHLAIERGMEIVGEAARQVSSDTKSAIPEIEWRQLNGLRNVLAHEYGTIKLDLLWDMAKEEVPVLIEHINRLLPDDPA